MLQLFIIQFKKAEGLRIFFIFTLKLKERPAPKYEAPEEHKYGNHHEAISAHRYITTPSSLTQVLFLLFSEYRNEKNIRVNI